MMSYRLCACIFIAVFFAASAADTSGPRFERSMQGTTPVPVVVDSVTGLMWQGCPAGKTGDLTSCNGTAATYTWSQANTYCTTTLNNDSSKNAGYTDWYLPDIKELESIVDDRYEDPAVDEEFFPGTPSGNFWSSSSCAPGSGYAWYVYFNNGYVYYYDKFHNFYVRCSRRGP